MCHCFIIPKKKLKKNIFSQKKLDCVQKQNQFIYKLSPQTIIKSHGNFIPLIDPHF